MWTPVVIEAQIPESPKADQTTFVAAQHLVWRDASDWMGDSFRVGLGPPTEPFALSEGRWLD
jgi:hypothetical protein